MNTVVAALILVLLISGTVLLLLRGGLSETEVALGLLASRRSWADDPHDVHANHPFFGALLATVLVPPYETAGFMIAVSALPMLQFINLVGRYGLGLNSLSQRELVASVTGGYGRAVSGSWSLPRDRLLRGPAHDLRALAGVGRDRNRAAARFRSA